MGSEFYIIVAAAACNLLVGSLVFSRAGHRLSNKLFLLVASSVAVWSIGIAFFLISNDGPQGRLLVNLYYTAAWCIGLGLYAFSRAWVGKPMPHLKPLFFLLVAVPALVLILDPNLIVTSIQFEPRLEATLNPVTQFFYSLGFIGAFTGGVYTLWKGLATRTGYQHSQLQLIVAGFVSAGVVGTVFNLAMPWFGVYDLIWVGPISSVLFVGCIAYAIVKHRLFDIHGFIVRSMAYIMSLTVMAAAYGLIVFGIAKFVFHLEIGVWPQVLISFATAVAAALFGNIKASFDRLTTKLFYHDAYDAQELLDTLNRLFVTNTDLERLLRDSSRIIEENFKSDYCFFGIRESAQAPQRIIGHGSHRIFHPDDIKAVRKITPHIHHKVIVTDELDGKYEPLRQLLEANNVAILGRLTANASQTVEGIGYLALGPRRSGNPYTRKDIRTLEIIVNELVIAIENSLRFEEINHFNATLQEKINDATRKLRNSNEKLQNLDATKDEFITMASHQLRTPLTSVKGYLSMVLEGDVGKLNKQQKEMLTQSYISSQRMVYLISDLLNLSRLNTGKFVIELTPVDLCEIVQLEIDQLRETAKSRGVGLLFDPPENLPRLMLDETKIHQVVMNLIDNAIYYTPSGGEVVISLRETPSAIEFRVVDNGIGVPKDVQHKLFTKFYRAQNAVAARPDGTGLGLFMAKKVIVAQGGAIIFESEVGKGSTFGFRFARAHHVAPATTVPAPLATKA